MPADGRFDGHIVQGHVDGCLECISLEDRNGSTRLGFARQSDLIIEKGSVCLDGVSLTVSTVDDERFTVDVIPLTAELTTFGSLRIGDKVNVEYDILGKYVSRMLTRH
jgi:riboflavin synthase